MLTPVSESPLSKTEFIGDGPRYFGRRDGCKLMHKSFDNSIKLFGIICPKLTITKISKFIADIFLYISSFIFSISKLEYQTHLQLP